MILAQCDVVISLVDDEYHNRAWCSVEAMMISTLMKSYGVHEWYEQPAWGNGDAQRYGPLRPGPTGLEIRMAEKTLSYEGDRPTVLFLERQSKLLG